MSAVVSVVIPCYRQGHFLSAAIESVLAQSHPAFEIIVVDDGSPDETGRIAAAYAARDPRVRCLTQPNRGLASARNAGLAAARGKYVVFLDADDLLLPEALAAGVASLERNPGCAFAQGAFEVIDAAGRPTGDPVDEPCPTDDHYALLLRNNWIWVPAAVMYRRSLFSRVAPFDPRVDAAADLEMYLRLTRQYPLHRHTTPVARYRRHAESMSSDYFVMAPAVHRVLQAQRSFVRATPSLRQAHRDGLRRWERGYLLPMMRQSVRRLAAGDVATIVGVLPLMVAHGPAAIARYVVRAARRAPTRG